MSNKIKCFAVFSDGVYEGIEHYRGQKMAKGCVEMVNFEFIKPDRYLWRGDVPAKDVFNDREAAQAEWERRFGELESEVDNGDSND